jgi:hypothetical protein
MTDLAQVKLPALLKVQSKARLGRGVFGGYQRLLDWINILGHLELL